MDFFKRRKILKRLNFLEAIPVRVCSHQEEEGGKVTLVVPKFSNQQFNDWFLGRRSKNFLIRLDEAGSKTWRLIDGNRTVGEISGELEKQNVGETVERVTKFMTMLYEQRYITFRQLETE